MKIALLGSASSSIQKAPFQNEAYAEWVQGRCPSIARAHAQVTGEFDIWGCSPGCWAVIPRATRWFEVHRWEPNAPWFGPEYMQFLRDFKGIVYTGGAVPEFPTHVVYPIDQIEEKFSSYFLTSSLALMLALAIDTIEQIRAVRISKKRHWLPAGVDPSEIDKDDSDDMIGMWGVDMAAGEEYAYQRPGCQFFLLEAMRRGIAVYLPPESDLMRPMPVYGMSEWDHNYIKLTARARELTRLGEEAASTINAAQAKLAGLQGENHALQYFVSTWTSPYGMQHGLVIRQEPGTGLGSGITHYDGRPVTRMTVGNKQPQPSVLEAMTEPPEAALGRELVAALSNHAGETGLSEGAIDVVHRLGHEGKVGRTLTSMLQRFAHQGETTDQTLQRIIAAAVKGKGKRRR